MRQQGTRSNWGQSRRQRGPGLIDKEAARARGSAAGPPVLGLRREAPVGRWQMQAAESGQGRGHWWRVQVSMNWTQYAGGDGGDDRTGKRTRVCSPPVSEDLSPPQGLARPDVEQAITAVRVRAAHACLSRLACRQQHVTAGGRSRGVQTPSPLHGCTAVQGLLRPWSVLLPTPCKQTNKQR